MRQLELFEATDRFNLGGITGLNYFPNFLNQEEQVWLLKEIDVRSWQNDLKRRVQHYGYKYDYRARKIKPEMFVGCLPEFAVIVAHKMLERQMIKELPDQVIVNEYLPGQGIAMHVDCQPCFKDTIVTISLGCTYEMDFQSTVDRRTLSFDLDKGSALVIAGESRTMWMHGIKMRLSDNGRLRTRRVSLTYRNVIME